MYTHIDTHISTYACIHMNKNIKYKTYGTHYVFTSVARRHCAMDNPIPEYLRCFLPLQVQKKVESYFFDVRKNLFEYDQVCS